MSRKCILERNKKRIYLHERYKEKRLKIKEQIRLARKNSNYSEIASLYAQLHMLPRDSSKVRQQNRCMLSGRARSYIRAFGMSRIKFRDYASKGMIPGIIKTSNY